MTSLRMRHPEDQRLLLYADGELPPREAAEIRSHLDSCWQCRTELEEIQKTVGECVRYRKNVLQAHLPPPPAPWGDIYRRFAEIDASMARPSLLGRIAQALQFRQLVPAAVALALIVIILQLFLQAPSARAAELLQKAVLAEKSSPAPRRIQIRSRKHRVIRAAGSPKADAPAELQALFAAAHYNWDEPLSARSFQAWRGQLSDKRDEVTTTADRYQIRTSTASGELAEATLELRRLDLRPVESTLQFRNDERVEIGELPDEPIAPPRPEVAAVPPAPADRPAVRETPSPAKAGDELQVLAALHRIGADLGEPIEVTRNGGQILVNGMGIPPGRREEIHKALGSMPHVVVEFSEPAAPLETDVTPPAAPAAGAEVSRLQARIEEQRGLAASLLDTSENVMARVYALRRLAERFPPALEAELGPEDRQILSGLRQEHASALNREAAELERLLTPVLSSLSGSVAGSLRSSISSGSWQPATEELFRAARRVESLLASVVGGAPAGAAEAELPSRLLTSVAELRAAAEAYQRLGGGKER